MKIQIKTSSYNSRRYGRPYVAVVDFTKNPKGDCRWGDWVGHPGEDGILVIEAEPHDVVMKGQKDNRGRGYPPEYGMVEADGTIEWCENKADAYALSLALQKS
jgi:hypothetical protein